VEKECHCEEAPEPRTSRGFFASGASSLSTLIVQWAYLSSLDRLSDGEVNTHIHRLPAVTLGQEVRRLELPPTAPRQPPRHSREVAEPTLALKLHRTSYAYDGGADPGEPAGISAIYKDLIANEDRLQLLRRRYGGLRTELANSFTDDLESPS
jgi:hypothetical protein